MFARERVDTLSHLMVSFIFFTNTSKLWNDVVNKIIKLRESSLTLMEAQSNCFAQNFHMILLNRYLFCEYSISTIFWSTSTQHPWCGKKKKEYGGIFSWKYDKHQHCTAVFQVVSVFSSLITCNSLLRFHLTGEKSRLIVSCIQALLWLLRLCLRASRDLARCEALFNMADAKVPRIQ